MRHTCTNHFEGCWAPGLQAWPRRGRPTGDVPAGKPAPGEVPSTGAAAVTAEDWVLLHKQTSDQ